MTVNSFANLLGISLTVVNDDKKWARFEKSLKENLALLQGGGGGALPDVADIFGAKDPQFADILQGISALQQDIELQAVAKKQAARKRRGGQDEGGGGEAQRRARGKEKQSYQSASTAM